MNNNALKKRLSDRLLWYFGLSESQVKKVPYIDEEEWCYIERWVDWKLDNFLSRLAKAYPNFTRHDLRICCLLRLNLSRSYIAALMGISTSSISTCKLRIKKKIIIQNPVIDFKEITLVSYIACF